MIVDIRDFSPPAAPIPGCARSTITSRKSLSNRASEKTSSRKRRQSTTTPCRGFKFHHPDHSRHAAGRARGGQRSHRPAIGPQRSRRPSPRASNDHPGPDPAPLYVAGPDSRMRGGPGHPPRLAPPHAAGPDSRTIHDDQRPLAPAPRPRHVSHRSGTSPAIPP